jgi:hypothetical protein
VVHSIGVFLQKKLAGLFRAALMDLAMLGKADVCKKKNSKKTMPGLWSIFQGVFFIKRTHRRL